MRRPRHGGFTLVELLVAMAVTLILIFALAQAFAIVGDTIATGRASIEMAGNLRTVAHRLQGDLDGITVAVRPWPDESGASGYLEYVEGPLSSSFYPSTDRDWDGDLASNVNPITTDTTRGDIDDILAFTTRNAESPFIGQYGNNVIQSSVAEVIWWIQYQDDETVPEDVTNKTGRGYLDEGEKFTIYRRVLLVRPDLGFLVPYNPQDDPNDPLTKKIRVVFERTGANAYPNNATGLQTLGTELTNLFNTRDISVRIRWWVDNNGVNVRLMANSLADLTRRENRFAHMPILSDRSPSGSAPNLLPVAQDAPYDALAAVVYNLVLDRVWMRLHNGPIPTFNGNAYPTNLDPVYNPTTQPWKYTFPLDVNRRSITSLYRMPKSGGNYGEDVMVSDALSFDVQAFDPYAPIRPSNAGDALIPSDPGYFVGWQDSNNDNLPDDSIGLGAFVDLGYGALYAAAGGDSAATNSSLFSGYPQIRARLRIPPPPAPNGRPIFTYCTWSSHYERNGVDEDGDGQTDEGTNGFDDPDPVSGNYDDGVDDVGERETSPPYRVPLRGIQIRIRTWDPDSRQVRQATVVADFVPE